MSIVTEIVTMKAAPAISKEVFVSIVEALEREFHSKQSGFIDTELLYNNKNGLWTMVQHWDTAEQQKAASKKMFQDEKAAAFVKALDPASVKMSISRQIQVWGK